MSLLVVHSATCRLVAALETATTTNRASLVEEQADRQTTAREDTRPPGTTNLLTQTSDRHISVESVCESAPQKTLCFDALAERFDIESTATKSGTTTWLAPDIELRFFDGSRRLEFNGTVLWMNGATTTNLHAESWQRSLGNADVETVLAPLLAPVASTNRSRSFVVVLDPGHGGNDPGAVVADMLPEKQLVLDIARMVKRKLKTAGIKVYMTRSGDQTLTLAQRPAFARKRHANVMISIHANKAPRKAAQGIETFVLPAAGFPSTSETSPVDESFPGNRHDAASTQLAYLLQRELIDQTQTVDRGVKRARFEVLRLAPCPAALVEVGFLSNEKERNRLREHAYRQQVADGIAWGIRIFMLQNGYAP